MASLPADADAALAKGKEVAEASMVKAQEALGTAQRIGFFDHWLDYSKELLMPWTLMQENQAFMSAPDVKAKALVLAAQAKDAIVSTVTLQPPVDAKANFIFYNVIGFWFGVFESLIYGLLGNGLLSLAWNGGISFCVAYTLYFTMTKSAAVTNAKPYMFYSLLFIAAYVALNFYLGITQLLLVVPAVLYFSKALCDVLMVVNGWHLYKAVIRDDSPWLSMV